MNFSFTFNLGLEAGRGEGGSREWVIKKFKNKKKILIKK